MREILQLFTSEDAQLNLDNKTFMVKHIQQKLRDRGINVDDQDYIGLVLDLIRIVHDIVSEENQSADDPRERDLFLYIIGATFYKIGIEAYTMEENQIEGMVKAELELEEDSRSVSEISVSFLQIAKVGELSDAMWVVIAFAYMADSGLNYRRYRMGKISPKNFWRQTSLLSLTTLEGLAGGAGGVALGFALGTLLLPGIGGIIGTMIGGVAGGLAGDRLML